MNDPVGLVDPTGLFPWGALISDAEFSFGDYGFFFGVSGWIDSSFFAVATEIQGTSPNGNYGSFSGAKAEMENHARTLSNMRFDSKMCREDLKALGIGPIDMRSGAWWVAFENAVGNQTAYSYLYQFASTPQVRQASTGKTGTVGSNLTPTTWAVAMLGGQYVYLNWPIIQMRVKSNLESTAHEILHNVTGLTDGDIQKRLRDIGRNIEVSAKSENIASQLRADCF
jgi:hypothetical protein